ncbi:MAG: TIGR03619 family F420-dependent LLM class oxidoreductase [Acidimicrobiales bacterium]
MVAFGMQLPIQSQSTIYAQPWEAAAGPAELVQIALACEAAGFDYVAVCDHVAIPVDLAEKMRTDWWDTIATLSYLAAVTERVRLLSHVYVLPYRHPLAVAKAWATLDALSGGRAILGVGAGHVEREFDVLEVPFAERGRLLDEGIDAVRAALTDEFASHAGERWRFEDLGQRPRPVQRSVPIWVGGSSKPAMRRAAERGDGWLPQGIPEGGMAAGIDFIRAHRAVSRGGDPITIGALSGPLHVGDPDWETPRCVRGSAEKIAGYLRTYVELGVDQIQVGFVSRSADELADQIAAFAADVAPLVNH